MYFHPLNALRLVLALGVVLFHYGLNYVPFSLEPFHTLILNSAFRVSFFFFISGFVMSLVYAPQGNTLKPGAFYKRRLTRIYPVYLLSFALTLLAVVGLAGASPKGLNIILHALGLQSFYPGHVLDLNYPAWSISVELVFYALFPWLLRWMVRLSPRRLLIYAAALWLLQSVQHAVFINYLYDGSKASEEFISTFPVWHLPTFFAGMATARLIALQSLPGWLVRYPLSWLSVALLMLLGLLYVPNPILKYIHNGLISPLFLLIVAGLYYDRSFLHRWLSHPRLSRLGDMSYGLFIFQYPLWLLCSSLVDSTGVQSPAFFAVYLVMLFAVAWLARRYYEVPLMRRLRGQ